MNAPSGVAIVLAVGTMCLGCDRQAHSDQARVAQHAVAANGQSAAAVTPQPAPCNLLIEEEGILLKLDGSGCRRNSDFAAALQGQLKLRDLSKFQNVAFVGPDSDENGQALRDAWQKACSATSSRPGDVRSADVFEEYRHSAIPTLVQESFALRGVQLAGIAFDPFYAVPPSERRAHDRCDRKIIAPVVWFQRPRALRGHYYWGAEVETLHPCGSDKAFWVTGTEQVLAPLREKARALSKARHKPYQPIYVEVLAIARAKPADGFAADYDGMYELTSVQRADTTAPPDCEGPGEARRRPAQARGIESPHALRSEQLNTIVENGRSLDRQQVRMVACLLVDLHGIMLEDCSQPRRLIAFDASSPAAREGMQRMIEAGWRNYPNQHAKVEVEVIGVLHVQQDTRDRYRIDIDQVLAIREPKSTRGRGQANEI